MGDCSPSSAVIFSNPTAIREMCVLALIGKFLSSPWVKMFYTSSDSQIDHVAGTEQVKKVIAAVSEVCKTPLSFLISSTNFFGGKIDDGDGVLRAVSSLCPPDEETRDMVTACLSAVLDTLSRQYDRYFHLDVTEELKRETESARSHNIDAEEMMGMFSAAKQRAPNATLCHLSSKLCAKKNKTVDHLDTLSTEDKQKVVRWAVSSARKRRQANRKTHEDMKQELSRRAAVRRQKKEEKERKKIETTIKNMKLEDLLKTFPELDKKTLNNMHDILSGTAVGRNICHL